MASDSIKNLPWNEIQQAQAFWDADCNEVYYGLHLSLKDRLANLNRRQYEQILYDISRGLLMVMDEIEKIHKVLGK